MTDKCNVVKRYGYEYCVSCNQCTYKGEKIMTDREEKFIAALLFESGDIKALTYNKRTKEISRFASPSDAMHLARTVSRNYHENSECYPIVITKDMYDLHTGAIRKEIVLKYKGAVHADETAEEQLKRKIAEYPTVAKEIADDCLSKLSQMKDSGMKDLLIQWQKLIKESLYPEGDK